MIRRGLSPIEDTPFTKTPRYLLLIAKIANKSKIKDTTALDSIQISDEF
jgi:hypothetical protein